MHQPKHYSPGNGTESYVRVAICLSGQPRAIEYALPGVMSFFSNREHTYDFFCHAWDYNTWKMADGAHSCAERVDRGWLYDKLSIVNPISIIVNSEDTIQNNAQYKMLPWASLMYSAMVSNHLKKLHEIKTGTRYDCVVRGRYDIIFHPYNTFRPLPMQDRTIYHPHLDRMPGEYNIPNASDVIFYGDSWGMDIIADTFRLLAPKPLYNDDFDRDGPGTIIYKHGVRQNIVHRCDDAIRHEVIYRKEMLGKHHVFDYAEIARWHKTYYA